MTLTGAPAVSLTLPEERGTHVEASLPVLLTLDRPQDPALSASLKITQDLNALFGWEKRDLLKPIRRRAAWFSLEDRIRLRRLEVERNLLELLKSLGEIEKQIVSGTTGLYEKETALESQLKGGTILRNGSSHLASLMEIRRLRTEIDEARIDLAGKREKIAEVTGMVLSGFPEVPEISLPVLPPGIPPPPEPSFSPAGRRRSSRRNSPIAGLPFLPGGTSPPRAAGASPPRRRAGSPWGSTVPSKTSPSPSPGATPKRITSPWGRRSTTPR